MKEIIPKRYAGLIGLGVMFMWGAALLVWVDLWKSNDTTSKVIGFVGACLVTASGISIFLYANSLEDEVNFLRQQAASNAAEARMWKSQVEEGFSGIKTNEDSSE